MSSKAVSPLITQNRLLCNARARAKSQKGAAAILAKGSDNGKKALLDAIKKEADNQRYVGKSEGAEKSKENYTAMKTAAEAIQKNVKNLQLWPDKEWDKMTEEEISQYKEDVAEEMAAFVNHYNTMAKSLEKESDSKVNEIYLKQLKGYFKANKDALETLGITQDEGGKLTLDQEKLKAADAQEIKKVLGAKGAFLDDVAKRAENISANADTNLAVLNKNLYAGNYSYNKNGGDIFDILAGGGKYSAKG